MRSSLLFQSQPDSSVRLVEDAVLESDILEP